MNIKYAKWNNPVIEIYIVCAYTHTHTHMHTHRHIWYSEECHIGVENRSVVVKA